MPRRLHHVDVFTTTPYRGNPVAVVLDAEGLTTEEMQRFANWTNLSETTFVLRPTEPVADYAVRIFTPVLELPFAGHPTLGTCHAWLASGGVPRATDETSVIVQECAGGLVPVRVTAAGLAFAAPPLVRSGAVDGALVARVADVLGLAPTDIIDAAWADNGPGWIAVLLAGPDEVLALRPGSGDLDIGVVGIFPPGSPAAIEVRAFFPKEAVMVEDPVTGSLNASLAQWLIGSGRLKAPYVASQGTRLGRIGRVHITQDADGTIWVGGGTITCAVGEVDL